MLVSPELVHKNSKDDVLIKNYARAVPFYFLEKNNFENNIDFLIDNKIRKRIRLDESFFEPELDGSKLYWKRTIPFQTLKELNLNKEFIKRVSHASEAYSSEEYIPSSFELVNLADNYYFYRKPHEHVPGTMFIEAARQSVYYHIYTTTKYVKGEVTITLDELNSRFFSYAEVMYPIEIIVDTIDGYLGNDTRKLFCRTTFYQKGQLICIVDSKVNIIDMDIFKKIRNIFLYSDYWYKPIDPKRIACTFFDHEGNEISSQLVGIGKRGCISSLPAMENQIIRSIKLAFDGKLYFSKVVDVLGEHEGLLLLKFKDLNIDDTYSISELIKRFFLLMEKNSATDKVDE
ncbi:AfsA-related hotdog domain-containing protein [Oceanospirillum maris]|uniref:AfsA-related hotdog domain-containing protein n=1 Tax=Oceanospirillum maris TaxID=64977 RepID=UPI00041E135F|nr:AfsA-related hotdog domain-containing protein [Oceanospirillum maris]